MTKSYLVQVAMPNVSAMPEDVVINTFSFIGPDIPTEPQRTELKTRLTAFYNSVHAPGTARLTSFFPSTLALAGTRIKAYRREDVVPRAPVFDDALPLTPGTGDPLPHEVALVMSFQATAISGTPQAQRRGRIYLGPLSTNVLTPASLDARPTGGFINAVKGAGSFLWSESDADWDWVVHSSIAGDATVVGGWVDNAFDSQRRRGTAPTVRSTF